jgi:hypothetical protein
MGDAGQGGPVRLGILLACLAALIAVGVKTVEGTEGASAGSTAGHGSPGRILAVASRRSIPRAVRRQVAVPPAHGSAAIRVAGATYLLGGMRRGPRGRRLPVASVLRRVGAGRGTRVAKLPTPVSGAVAAVVGDRLYAIGGRLRRRTRLDQIADRLVRLGRDRDPPPEAALAGQRPDPRRLRLRAGWCDRGRADGLDPAIRPLAGRGFPGWSSARQGNGWGRRRDPLEARLPGRSERSWSRATQLHHHPEGTEVYDEPTETRSITNTRVAFGGIVGGWPWGP